MVADDALTSLDLPALSSVGGNLDLVGNDALTSLDLSALSSVGGTLIVTENAVLAVCCSLTGILQTIDLSDVSIRDNAPGCNTVAEIEINCRTRSVIEVPTLGPWAALLLSALLAWAGVVFVRRVVQ